METPITPIGFIHSCFPQKFGIPRQPGLVPAARATLTLLPPYAVPEAVRGLEGFSHLWLIFLFHGIPMGQWQPTVRPPRLGGDERLGVFATRSPFRPNPIGLSVVRLEEIVVEHGCSVLHLSGVDVLDGTPVIDIKPYLPYTDCVPQATGGFATTEPAGLSTVTFSPTAERFFMQWPDDSLRTLIVQVLQQDPRPAYHRENGRRYGMQLCNCNVHWEVVNGVTHVMDISLI